MKSLFGLRDRLTLRTLALIALAVIPLALGLLTLGVTTEDVTQHNGLATSDPSHLRLFTEHRSPALIDVARTITDLGAVSFLVVCAVVAACVLWWRGQRAVVAIAPASALLAAALVAGITKQVVGRARPPSTLHLITETEPSFPSGHATDSTAFFVTLALLLAIYVFRKPIARATVVASTLVLAGLIGLTRLVLGVHWPTDVLAGWSLGFVIAVVTVLLACLIARPTNTAAVPRSVRSAAVERPMTG